MKTKRDDLQYGLQRDGLKGSNWESFIISKRHIFVSLQYFGQDREVNIVSVQCPQYSKKRRQMQLKQVENCWETRNSQLAEQEGKI